MTGLDFREIRSAIFFIRYLANPLANNSNSKTLPSRKFAQFNNNFEQLEKQQKHLDRLQKHQQQQQQHINQEFINPFPYYRHYPAASSILNKQNFNSFVMQHQHQQQQQSSMQRNYPQNLNAQSTSNNISKNARNRFLLHKLESSLVGGNVYDSQPYTNSNSINKKNSEFKSNNSNNNNTNNKRRSTQVFNL